MAKLSGCDESLENVIGVPTTTVDPFAGLGTFSKAPSAAIVLRCRASLRRGPYRVRVCRHRPTAPVAMTIAAPIALTLRQCRCSRRSIVRSYTNISVPLLFRRCSGS